MTLCYLYALACRWHRAWTQYWTADHRYWDVYNKVTRQIDSCDGLKRR
jgi:hypothetical protein